MIIRFAERHFERCSHVDTRCRGGLIGNTIFSVRPLFDRGWARGEYEAKQILSVTYSARICIDTHREQTTGLSGVPIRPSQCTFRRGFGNDIALTAQL